MLCLFKLPPNVCCLSPHAQGLRGRCVGSCETPFRVCFNNSCNRQHLSEKLNVSRFSMNITLHLLCICWRYNIFFSRYCLYKTHGSGFFFSYYSGLKPNLKKSEISGNTQTYSSRILVVYSENKSFFANLCVCYMNSKNFFFLFKYPQKKQ